MRPTTGKLTKLTNTVKMLKGISAAAKPDHCMGGTLPRYFDILKVTEPPAVLELMTDMYLMSVPSSSPKSQRAVTLPAVKTESGVAATQAQKLVLATQVSSISNVMQLAKKFHRPSSSIEPCLKLGSNADGSSDKHVVKSDRDQVLIEICHSAGMKEVHLDANGDTLTSLILQVPKSFRDKSVQAMRLKPGKFDSAESKLIAEKHIDQGVISTPTFSGQQVPFPSDFLQPLNFESEPMNQSEMDDPTILLFQGSDIALAHEILLPDGCTIIQKHRTDGKNEIRINFGSKPVERSEAQRSLIWFLNQWKTVEHFDSERKLSNVQTAWAILSVSFMDVTRQNFLICKERGVHLIHLWLHLSSFACRGITLAQTIASDFAASEVKYLQKIREFESNFTSEVDKLHKFYQKQLNLAWNTEERYKIIIMGLEKDKTDLHAQLDAVSDSAIYSELAALRTFHMNFAENTKFMRDLIIDATTNWNKRASNHEQRWKAQAAGEVESAEKIALTIGKSDQQDWELKMNELFSSKETHDRESNILKESNFALIAEVTNLREELEQYYNDITSFFSYILS